MAELDRSCTCVPAHLRNPRVGLNAPSARPLPRFLLLFHAYRHRHNRASREYSPGVLRKCSARASLLRGLRPSTRVPADVDRSSSGSSSSNARAVTSRRHCRRTAIPPDLKHARRSRTPASVAVADLRRRFQRPLRADQVNLGVRPWRAPNQNIVISCDEYTCSADERDVGEYRELPAHLP